MLWPTNISTNHGLVETCEGWLKLKAKPTSGSACVQHTHRRLRADYRDGTWAQGGLKSEHNACKARVLFIFFKRAAATKLGAGVVPAEKLGMGGAVAATHAGSAKPRSPATRGGARPGEAGRGRIVASAQNNRPNGPKFAKARQHRRKCEATPATNLNIASVAFPPAPRVCGPGAGRGRPAGGHGHWFPFSNGPRGNHGGFRSGAGRKMGRRRRGGGHTHR